MVSIIALMALVSHAVAQQFVMYTPGGDDTAVQRIDPILAPGAIGQHVHQVFGASNLTPDMSYDSLQQSNCTTVADSSNRANAFDNSVYWHPALFAEALDGSGYIRIPTNGHKLYYQNAGSEKDTKASPFEFPKGFRMVAGNPFIRTAPANKHLQNITQWICHDASGSNQGTDGGFPKGIKNCNAVDGLNGAIHFPHCWNGQDFDPANPFAHVVYPDGDIAQGECPSNHSTRLPHIFIENTFNIDKVWDKIKPDSFVLAQGDNTGYGWHADFFNGWAEGAIPALIDSCPAAHYGNEDVGICSYFKGRSTPADKCKLPITFHEEVTNPGQHLPGCNPVVDTNPAPIMPVAPLGIATDVCSAFANLPTASLGEAANGGSAPAATNSPSSPSTSSSPSSPSTTTSPSASTTAGAASIIPGTPSLNSAIPTTVFDQPTQFSIPTTFATFFSNAASAAAPSSSSSSSEPSCPSGNGTSYTTNGATFTIECGIDHAGGDLSSKQVSCFSECITACATTSGCVDVSYMGAECYLKKSLGNTLSNHIVNGAKLVTSGSTTSAASAPTGYDHQANIASAITNFDHQGNIAYETQFETVTAITTAWIHPRHGHRHDF